jgi:hypothetical protein
MRHIHTIAVLGLALLAVSPAAARRRRVRRAPVRHAAAAPAPAPDVARSVIFIIADGYTDAHWREARADGFLAMDRMPVVGMAVPPPDLDAYDGLSLGRVLGAGRERDDAAPTVPLLGLARQYGESVALVGGGAAASPVLRGLTVGAAPEADADAWRRLIAARVDVLFGRSLPDVAGPLLKEAGYAVDAEADALLKQESTPAAAVVPADNVPFETLLFRALHLAAKAPKGFMLAVSANPSQVPASALDAAVATAVRFADRDRRTLVVVADQRGETGLILHAAGPAAGKFSGAIAATDVPKILAGVTGLKVFRRDFSPLFQAHAETARATRTALKPAGKGIRPLPW